MEVGVDDLRPGAGQARPDDGVEPVEALEQGRALAGAGELVEEGAKRGKFCRSHR